MDNNFFTSLENTSPFFKANAVGEAGSGKSYTLALIVHGLHNYIKSDKPIVIFDTEKSGKFLRPMFKKAGIEVLLKESRTLPDLTETMKFCSNGGSDILLIDSITHVWEDFLNDYMQQKGRKRLQFQDWGFIKPTWKREFSDRLVNANCHILFTGRQGFTYDYEMIDGKKELVKTGIKMKAEGETAYEPDLLLHMERFEELLDKKNKKVWREATVLKDRANLIDNRTFRNPTFADFKPILDFLMTDVMAPVETTSRPNTDLIDNEADNRKERQDRKIALERNIALLDKVAAGTSGPAKALRLALIEYAYHGETSDVAINEMSLAQLLEAHSRLESRVPPIANIIRGEDQVYPLAKVVTAARMKYVETTNLGEVDGERLQAYLDHIVEKYTAQVEKAKTDAEKEEVA